MTQELLEKVAALKTLFEQKQKDLPTRAEFDEFKVKVGKDREDLDKVAKANVTRIGTPGEPSDNGIRKLIARGVKKMAFKATDERGQFEAAQALGNMYETNHLGMLTHRKRWEDSEMKVLELAELVVLADALAQGADPDWQFKKMRGGEREVFMAKFPKIGGMWDRVMTEFRKTTDIMDTTTTAQGIEWIPTAFNSTLTDQIRLGTPELNLFEHVTMPTSTWKWPIKTSVGAYYIKAEGVAATLSGPRTAAITFSAKLFAYYTQWTDEIAEDSIIAILPMLRADAFRATAEGKSRAIISGDREGTHMDTDIAAGSAVLPEKNINGLRHYALHGTDNKYDAGTLATFTSTIAATAAGQMGKYAAGRMGDLVLLVGTMSWLNLLLDTNMVTIDKMGPQATLLTGQVGSVFGIPVIISHGVQSRNGATGAATGVTGSTGLNDGGANTSGTAILVNRNVWKIGDRRQDTIEQDKNVVTGVNTLVLTNRWDFVPLYQPTSYPTTHDATVEPHTTVITDIAK